MTDDTDVGLDLSPRPAPVGRPRSARRRWAPIILLALVVVAGGVIVVQFLGSAVDYYCNVNEIGSRNGCESGRRLRVQGTVDARSLTEAAGETDFTMSFDGVSIPVHYSGTPGGIFKECEPVIVHGVLQDGVFQGDDIEVKHSNKYAQANPDRLAGDQSACPDTL